MIKDLLKDVEIYRTGMLQSQEVKGEALKFIKENYLPDSAVFNKAEEECLKLFNETVEPLKKNYVDSIGKGFTEVKEQLMDAITGSSVPDEFLKIVPMYDSMSDFEKSAIMRKYGSNYMCMKMLHQGDDSFKTLEHIVEDMDNLQSYMNKVTSQGIDNYNTANVLYGDYVGRVSDEVEQFINTYSVKGGDSIE